MSTEPESGSGGRPDRHPSQMAVGTTAATFLRKPIGHSVPPWVASGNVFFITICCATRGVETLTKPVTAERVLSAARFYHERERWFVRLMLLMPDHLHALIAFPRDEAMVEVIRNWKSYLSRNASIEWQRNFFDHRLRSDESWEEKAHYIRMNPVRAGLIRESEPWTYIFETR